MSRIEIDGVPKPVLWREYEGAKCETACPFCGEHHLHGLTDGHRVPHCITHSRNFVPTAVICGYTCKHEDGYIVRSRSNIKEAKNMKKPLLPSDTLPETGLIRLPTVLKYFQVSKSSWWRGVRSGKYPKGIRNGKRCTFWRAEEIHKLIEKMSKGAI